MTEKTHVDSPNQFLNVYKSRWLIMVYALLSVITLQAQNPNAHENATVYGGDITFLDGETYNSICIDGEADFVEVVLENASGRVKQWVITNEDGDILGLPDHPSDVNFDEAGVGVCLIYHLSYNGIKPLIDPSGQGKFTNNINDIVGKFDLSEPIILERFLQPTAGVLEGGPFEFCVGDDVADMIPEGDITLSGNMGTNATWVVTDDLGNILGLPDSPYEVNFDEAPAGTCLVWHLSYENNVSLDINNASELSGCFALSNPITVDRYQQPTAGVLEGGPFEFCVGDGVADMIPEGDITLSGNAGTNSTWVVTDDQGNILELPDSPYEVNFDEAPAGICLVWHLSYEDNVSLDINNASELSGCFALSNAITVNRYQQPTAGVLEGGPFEFCVGDDVADNIPEGDITLSGNAGTNATWIVTDDLGNILGLPGSPYEVNFDEAPAGTCLVWHLSYEDNVSLDINNASELSGCFALSNAITVNRIAINGGSISGGDENSFSFTVGDNTEDKIEAEAITLEDNIGTNSKWLVTNEDGTIILGVHDNYTDPNFDGAEAGTCKLWHLSYEDGLEGLTAPDEGDHLVSGLTGACFDLSNDITIERTAASTGKIALFPNPSKSKITVDMASFAGDDVNVSLYDLHNSRLMSKEISLRNLSKMKDIDISEYDSGLYFIKVTNLKNGSSSIKRLIIE